jgi:hypothetical protein
MGWRSMEADWYVGIAYCCECAREFSASDSVVEGGAEDAICSDECYDKYIGGPVVVNTFYIPENNGEEPDVVY